MHWVGDYYDPNPNDPTEVAILKITSVTSIYSYVIWFLGIIVIVDVCIVGAIIFHGPVGSDTAVTIPDGLVAIGSAAVGAIAGILTQPPSQSSSK